MRRNKFNAKPTVLDGYRFDSQKEAKHYGELKLLQRAGEIKKLTVHPHYPIVVEGQQICIYEADFSFTDVQRGTVHVQDVKGHDTALSRIKRKLVKAVHGIEVEVIK